MFFESKKELSAAPFFVSRKPRDSRVVGKRLTDERKTSVYDIIKTTCQSKYKNIYGGLIYEKGSHRQEKFSTYKMKLQESHRICAKI